MPEQEFSTKHQFSTIQIHAELVAHPDNRLIVDGVDYAGRTDSWTISGSSDDVTRLILSFPCERVDIDGKAEVIHFCPLGGQSA